MPLLLPSPGREERIPSALRPGRVRPGERHLLPVLLLALLVPVLSSSAGVCFAAGAGVHVLAVDRVGQRQDLPPAADLLAVTLHEESPLGGPALRVSFLSLAAPGGAGGVAVLREAAAGAAPAEVALELRLQRGSRTLATRCGLRRGAAGYRPAVAPEPGAVSAAEGLAAPVRLATDPDALWLALPADLAAGATAADPLRVTVGTLPGEEVRATYPAPGDYQAHCALVLHGNQGLGYTDVFVGRPDDPDGSGFDEALQVHEGTGVPGNFHLAGTLQTAAEWSARNGDPMDFNAWLAAGVTAGWAGMVTSAYAQHIMPFVQDAMNDWAVDVETRMVDARYGYFPTVAWVPERVWLNTSGYPSAGVNDWIGDDWQPHGVQAVILDDDVHLAGHDNHQIHTLDANGLRLVPRDRAFTGDIVGGDGQAALDILAGLAGSGVGQYRIAVFAEDWEAVAEMGSWAGTTPAAKETYDWFVGKCAQESGWLHTWKLADAVANPDFTGATIGVTPGTYWEIGGTDGYGGGDNGWYTHWAGWVPWVDGGDGYGNCAGAGGSCLDYGGLWNDAYTALMAAPDNDISQAGWYVMMTNLHETAWHDGLGGPISGWQHRYASHVKNALVFAEAARWADGQYLEATAAFATDIDHDGYDEYVLHNDRLFAVIEATGGRVTHLFVKGPGYDDVVIGNDNAYWSDTEGDYNDANHCGAFSDVGPDHQHQPYDVVITGGSGPTASIQLARDEVTKELSLTTGESHLRAVYRVGPAEHWLRAGFSPSLVDLVWNAEMDRVWAADAAYMGRRNPNTGVAAAFVLGDGGAAHQLEFAATLMKGDEVHAAGAFEVWLYGGPTGAPDGGGEIAELRALADALVDVLGPAPLAAGYWPATGRLRVEFDQAVDPASAEPTGFGVDADADGLPEVVLGAGTTVLETAPSFDLTFELDPTTAADLAALGGTGLLLLVDAGAVADGNGVGNDAVTEADGIAIGVAATGIAVDGLLEAGEWGLAHHLPDSLDSAWTAANEIDGLYAGWDSLYLYLAIDGIVTGNSWLLYLDVDPDGAAGQIDLTAIDVWERGAVFTAPGFRPDFEYGCYQHQSVDDGDGFWQLLSATTTADRSAEVATAFDSFHLHGDAGGSELAIPWDVLYGLGEGIVPAGARIALAASVCWDPEPNGVLGGDSVPSNLAAALPTVDSAWTLVVDGDGDGRPDRLDLVAAPPAAPAAALSLLPPAPNPFNPQTRIVYTVPGPGEPEVRLEVCDLRGRRLAVLVDGPLPAGRHETVWRGRDGSGRPLAAGAYLLRLECAGRAVVRPVSLIK